MNITRAMVIVEEEKNREIVFATECVGVIAANTFWGLKASCSNLCAKDQIVKIAAPNIRRSRCCGAVDDVYPFYTITTDTNPINDSRISIIDFDSKEVSTDIQCAVLDAFYGYFRATSAC